MIAYHKLLKLYSNNDRTFDENIERILTLIEPGSLSEATYKDSDENMKILEGIKNYFRTIPAIHEKYNPGSWYTYVDENITESSFSRPKGGWYINKSISLQPDTYDTFNQLEPRETVKFVDGEGRIRTMEKPLERLPSPQKNKNNHS
jgi:hypothetical protein